MQLSLWILKPVGSMSNQGISFFVKEINEQQQIGLAPIIEYGNVSDDATQ